MRRQRMILVAAITLCVSGAALFGGAGYIHAKAFLAQQLLERAWDDRLAGGDRRDARPWPWADTVPVARLQVPRLGIDQIVLSGASGRTLAFGPAHLESSAMPGARGHTIVTGHRDTHFGFLNDLEPGDEIHLQTADGMWHHYQISGSEIFDSRTARFASVPHRRVLTLVTCWPFDAVAPGGPLRYAVFGDAETRAASQMNVD